jgi:hypothetical protein
MNVWKLISGVVLLLFVGILFGSIGTWILIKPPRPPGPWDHRNRTADATERLSKELNLSEAQREAIEKILLATSEELHERFLQAKPEIDKIIDSGYAEVREQLNEAQKKKFDVMRKKFGRFPGGPPGPPGSGPPFMPPPPR